MRGPATRSPTVVRSTRLSLEVDAAIAKKAAERGISPSQLVAELLEKDVGESSTLAVVRGDSGGPGILRGA